METLTDGDTPTLVSNVEVMKLLSERIASRKQETARRRKQSAKLQHRDWIEDKVHEYLKSTPCANVDVERMPELVKALRGTKDETGKVHSNCDGNTHDRKPSATTEEGFGLTDAETLQILNFMPQEPVEIHLMIEELHSRMSDDRQEELLKLVGTFAEQGDSKTSGDQVMDEADHDIAEYFEGDNENQIMENGCVNPGEYRDAEKLNGGDLIRSTAMDGTVVKREPSIR